MTRVPPCKLPLIGHKFETQQGLEKRLLSCGPLGTRLLWLTNGEPALPLPPFPSKAPFACLILVNVSYISSRTKSKLVELGGGQPTLCMTFVVSRRAIMTTSIVKNHSLGKNPQEVHQEIHNMAPTLWHYPLDYSGGMQ